MDAKSGWNEIQQIALKNNPKIWERVTGQKIGQISEGYPADLVIVDYYPPTPLNDENIWGHILYGIADSIVDTVIINGQIVMNNKQLTTVSEAEIAAKARECAERVWKKM